ncbi:MAG: stage III sporulation protein AD [Dethiobacter sp.]|jgi:stage III sporulation protein AD|nr:MAG: stage III sporulation protein AD [Dethiobacter sp.]
MEIAQIVVFGVIAAIFITFIRQSRPEIAQLLSLAVGIVIVAYLLGYLKMIIDVITDLALEAEINTVFLRTLLRVIGVAYLAEFGAQICRDAGEGSIAVKIEFAGKLIILVMAIPILIAVLQGIVNFIP